MEVTSTASQASLHLSLAFNGLERRGLIFMLSLSIRRSLFSKVWYVIPSNYRNFPVSNTLVSMVRVACRLRTRLSGYLQLVCCPELQGFNWGGAATIFACKPSIPQSIRTFNVDETSVCHRPLCQLWQSSHVSLAGQLQSHPSATDSQSWHQIPVDVGPNFCEITSGRMSEGL